MLPRRCMEQPVRPRPQAPTARRTAPYPAATGSSWSLLRAAVTRAWDDAESPSPLPPVEDRRRRFWYGLGQPLLGMRLLLRDMDMMSSALVPVLFVAIVCAIAAAASLRVIDSSAWWAFDNVVLTTSLAFVIAFFTTFAALAPFPPFLFARHYARMAARSRDRLYLGPRKPYLKPISQSIGETLAQAAVIAIGFAPVTLLLAIIPVFGPVLAFVAQLGWTMHWMVIESLDNGRTLAPDESVEHVLAAERAHPHKPWFARALDRITHPRLQWWLRPLRGFVEVMESLVRGWGPELRMVERDRALSLGFGVGVFVLLVIPGINLLFRPALVIAAAHLRGQLELEADGQSQS